MNPQVEQAIGSPDWQLVFLSFALVLVGFEILRGWRRGVAQQLARLGALVAAYFTAFYGGKFVAPLLKPLVKMPDALISVFAGAVLALIVYVIIGGLGTILFRRTSQHESAFMRLLYGASGALLGFFFGAFLVWLMIVGIRSVGAVAQARVQEQAANATVVHAVDFRRGRESESTAQSAPLATSLARLKNSLEMGVIGEAVKKTDVMPEKIYDTLSKAGQVMANAKSAERFLSFPGVHELSKHPRIVALENDREIADMIAQGRFVDLLGNEKIIQTFNDPTLMEQLKKFDFNGALTYALQK
jgi:hypothetical protein